MTAMLSVVRSRLPAAIAPAGLLALLLYSRILVLYWPRDCTTGTVTTASVQSRGQYNTIRSNSVGARADIMKDFDGETTDDVRFAPSSPLALLGLGGLCVVCVFSDMFLQ